MRRNLVPILLFFAAVVAVGLIVLGFIVEERGRYAGTERVRTLPSDIKLGMRIHHTSGPILDEYYSMRDLNGLSTSEYRAVGRSGLVVRVASLPRETVDVAFLFDRTVADGIWELPDRPIRGDASLVYMIDVYQETYGKHGSHRFTFTDPHYWATTGGHQFHIRLEKNKPLPDLLKMSSTTLVEPRYERLVADFLNFGTPPFRAKIAAAQAKLRARTKG